MAEAAKEFIGTERYVVRRRLGAGGMGVVYEAHDRQMDKTVALKTLTRAEAGHIYRSKREFGTLAVVSHPNLVTLYEMMSDGKYWFFTMEMVKGITFIQYVRPELNSLPDRSADDTLRWLPSRPAGQPSSEAETEEFDSSRISLESGEYFPIGDDASPGASLCELDEARLRLVLRQLAEGVNRLHEMGKLHRDLNDLCMNLLRRDSKKRPTGREVIRALSDARSGEFALAPIVTQPESVFVGRERQ